MRQRQYANSADRQRAYRERKRNAPALANITLPAPYYQDEWVTLYCGDCTALLPFLAPGSIDLVLTDPPYNVSTADASGNLPYKTKGGKVSRKLRHFGDWDRGWSVADLLAPALRLLRPGGSLVSFTSDHIISDYYRFPGYEDRGGMTWIKTNPPVRMRATGYRPGIEHLVWLARPGGAVTWHGGGGTINTFAYPICAGHERLKKADGTALHPTQKPIKLVKDLIRLHSNTGNLILDPYVGVGTTLVAAKRMGRRAIGIERDEAYCNQAAARLAQAAMDLGDEPEPLLLAV
jgi:DNA modification methylase